MPRRTKRRNNNNNTRIHVSFKAIIEPSWTPDSGTGGGGFQSIPLNVAITDLTKELGLIYKLYRFVNVRLDFQADPNPSTTILSGKPTYVCTNYIPAKESPITVWPNPTDLEKFEGPAVGFYAANRGHPYTYKVPKAILLSMPYNWYETKQNTPQFSDYTQGQLFLKTTDANYFAPILAHFVVEFQTMEDPQFLTSLTQQKPERAVKIEKRKMFDEVEEESDCVSMINANDAFEGRIFSTEKYCTVQRL
jgi:hypothetical protein